MASHTIVYPQEKLHQKRLSKQGAASRVADGWTIGMVDRLMAGILIGFACIVLLGYLAGSAGLFGAARTWQVLHAPAGIDSQFSPGRTVVVRSGDTLWSLAKEHGPAGVDTRAVVDWIRRENGLESALLIPGERVVVPATGGK